MSSLPRCWLAARSTCQLRIHGYLNPHEVVAVISPHIPETRAVKDPKQRCFTLEGSAKAGADDAGLEPGGRFFPILGGVVSKVGGEEGGCAKRAAS